MSGSFDGCLATLSDEPGGGAVEVAGTASATEYQLP